jgi:hydrogenase assembly chaperone HypC/HupF
VKQYPQNSARGLCEEPQRQRVGEVKVREGREKDGGCAFGNKMCLGIPGKIIELIDPENGVVKTEVAGVRRNVSVQLLSEDPHPVRVGDWILIHVGFALCRID